MNFKLNAFIVAALMATGGSAQAIIVDGSTGNGELFMTVLDSVGQKSYTMDLNLTMSDFLSGIATSGASYNYAADANMASFLSMVAPADKSGLLFAIGAMDASGATATDFHHYITTASTIDLGNTVTNLNLKNLGGQGSFYLGDVNGSIGAGNSLIVTDSSTLAYAGSGVWGSNWGSAFNGNSTGLIGSDLNLYLLEQTSGTFTLRNNPSVYSAIGQGGNPVFANLDMSGNLTISAVPEAETYAMMLAGLGLVGFMVSRRRQA